MLNAKVKTAVISRVPAMGDHSLTFSSLAETTRYGTCSHIALVTGQHDVHVSTSLMSALVWQYAGIAKMTDSRCMYMAQHSNAPYVTAAIADASGLRNSGWVSVDSVGSLACADKRAILPACSPP